MSVSSLPTRRPASSPPLFVEFPLKYRSKEPAVKFKSKDRFDTEGIPNIGRRLDGLVVLDPDVGRMPEGITLATTLLMLEAAFDVPLDRCPRVRTGSGGEHIYMRLPPGAPKLTTRLFPWVDVKSGPGSYVVAPGSTHPNGNKYKIINDVPIEDAPVAPARLMRAIERPPTSGKDYPPGLLNPDRLAIVLQGLDVDEFAEHDRWLELMMACRHACPEGELEFVEWSTSDPAYAHEWDEIAKRWHSVDPFVEGGITSATLCQRLIEAKAVRPDDLAPRRALAIMDFAGLEPEEEPGREAAEAPEKARDAFPLLTVDDLLALSPPEWLLERALPRGSLGVLYGPPKSAKTFLALDVGLSVAAGLPDVHGLRCKSGRVLYVLAEGGASMMRDRVWCWIESHGAVVGDRFVVHPRAVNLADPRAVERLLEHAGLDWNLVVFDTLARCMDGDENSVKDMHAAISGCDDVRERTGAAVLLVHHSGKDQTKGMRGSTALLGAVDAVLKMRPDGARDYVFEVDALRHGEPADDRRLTLRPIGGSAVLVASTAQSDFDPQLPLLEIASSVEDGLPRSAFKRVVAQELGVSESTANRRIAETIPVSRDEAVEAPNGSLVWMERDAASTSPNAWVMRRRPVG